LINLKLTYEQADILIRLIGWELYDNDSGFDQVDLDTLEILESMITKEMQ